MTPDYSIRITDRRIVGLLAAVLVVVVALLGFSMRSLPQRALPLQASARAAPAPAAATAVREDRAADESAHGMRSESAH